MRAVTAKAEIIKAYQAAMILLAHMFIVLVIIVAFTVVEISVNRAGSFAEHGGELLLYDAVPIKYVFQTIDLALIVTFGVFGILEAKRVFQEKE